MNRTPPLGAIKEALNYPNRVFYEIDPEFENKDNVPPEAIKGAWAVNENGIITGEFIPNPNYLDKQ